jgi:restriction endonuclease Mrr
MFPKYEEIQIPLLKEILKRGGRIHPSDKNSNGKTVYEELAEYFNLSSEALNFEIYESNGKGRSKWKNMVRWTRNDLVKKGFISSANRGIWEITETGKSKIKQSR